jgi:hypothetical protein
MTHNTLRRSAFCLLSVLSVSCVEGESSADGAPSAGRDSAGVHLVDNGTPVWADGTGWKVDSVPLTSVGGDDTDLQQQFRSISAALRMANGNVAIAADNELRLFAPDGRYLRTLARQGSGPGEFRSLQDVWRLAGDSLLATQSLAGGGMKNVLIGPDGALVREEQPNVDRYRALGPWAECMSLVLPDRSRITCQDDPTIPLSATNRGNTMDARGYASPGPGMLRRLKRQHVLSPSLDTSYRLGITAEPEQFGVLLNGQYLGFSMHPLYSRSLTAAGGSPLRIVTFMNPGYELQVWTPTGRLETIIRRVGARRATSEQERKDALDEVLTMTRSESQDPALLAQMAAIPMPDSLPAAVSLTVAATGEMLVMREGLLPSQRQSLYDVFDRTGAWLGVLRLPRHTRITDVGRDYLLVIRNDDRDGPRAEVLRLYR